MLPFVKKPQAIQLSIPAPCGQSWDDMKPEGNGRHCVHCEKAMVDFTRMTDMQLLDYFKKNEGGCGRFTSEQLNRTIQEVIVPQSSWWARIAAGVLLMVGLSKNATAQQQNQQETTEQIPLSNSADDTSRTEKSHDGGIYGTLTDDKGNPVVNATVEISMGGIVKGQAMTDFDGTYSIQSLDSGKYEISFKSQNYVLGLDEVQISQNEIANVYQTIIKGSIPGKTAHKIFHQATSKSDSIRMSPKKPDGRLMIGGSISVSHYQQSASTITVSPIGAKSIEPIKITTTAWTNQRSSFWRHIKFRVRHIFSK